MRFSFDGRFPLKAISGLAPLFLLGGCIVAPCPAGVTCGVAAGTGGHAGVGGDGNGGDGNGGDGNGGDGSGGDAPEAGGTGNGGMSAGNGGKAGGTGGKGAGGAPPMGSWEMAAGNLIGMDSECGNLSAVAAKPDEDMIVTGVAQHGLWASRDGGKTYEQLGTGAGSDPITNRASWFIFDPDHSTTFWESGIYNGPGIYRTDDDGVTLNTVGPVRHNDYFSIDFTDPDRKTIVAGGHEAPQQLFLTTDGGKSWDSIASGLPADNFSCVFPLVMDAQTYLVGCGGYAAGSESIYRTTDSGNTWTKISDVGGAFGGLVAKDGSIYWARAHDAGMTRSTDNGMTFETVSGMGTATSATPIELPDGRIAALGATAIIVSADQGKTWKPVTVQMPYKPVGLTYSAQRKAFYIWHFSCGDGSGAPVPVPMDAIMRHDFDYEKK